MLATFLTSYSYSALPTNTCVRRREMLRGGYDIASRFLLPFLDRLTHHSAHAGSSRWGGESCAKRRITLTKEGVKPGAFVSQDLIDLLPRLDSWTGKPFIPLLEQFCFVENMSGRLVQSCDTNFSPSQTEHVTLLEQENAVLREDCDSATKIKPSTPNETRLAQTRGLRVSRCNVRERKDAVMTPRPVLKGHGLIVHYRCRLKHRMENASTAAHRARVSCDEDRIMRICVRDRDALKHVPLHDRPPWRDRRSAIDVEIVRVPRSVERLHAGSPSAEVSGSLLDFEDSGHTVSGLLDNKARVFLAPPARIEVIE